MIPICGRHFLRHVLWKGLLFPRPKCASSPSPTSMLLRQRVHFVCFVTGEAEYMKGERGVELLPTSSRLPSQPFEEA